MKIVTNPSVNFPILLEDLEIVVRIVENSLPEIYYQGVPNPDRHMLLGLIQSSAMAIEEKDPELVYFTDFTSIELQRDDETRPLYPGVIVIRSVALHFGVLAPYDRQTSRRMARAAVRYFMGTIRLDVP
jgi:hypothetical protein